MKNRKNKNGSWTLSGEYLDYRREGGKLSPETYQSLINLDNK
jgi:hypothetical protein